MASEQRKYRPWAEEEVASIVKMKCHRVNKNWKEKHHFEHAKVQVMPVAEVRNNRRIQPPRLGVATLAVTAHNYVHVCTLW